MVRTKGSGLKRIPPFLRNGRGNNGGADLWFGEVLRRIMQAFELAEVTPAQAGAFFEKSPQRGSMIIQAAGLVKHRLVGHRSYYHLPEVVA